MNYRICSSDSEEMVTQANIIKDVVLEALEREGLLTKPAKEIGEMYAVVFHKRGWFGACWAKCFGDEKRDNYFRINLLKSV